MELPPRLARIVGGTTDKGHINVELFVPLHPEDEENGLDEDASLWHQNLKQIKYVPLYPHHPPPPSLHLPPTPPPLAPPGATVISIPTTWIAREIKPFNLSRKSRIDPTRLEPIRTTNLHRSPMLR